MRQSCLRISFRSLSAAAIVAAIAVAVVGACGPNIVFRAYLNKTMWVVTWADWRAALGPDSSRKDYLPYAGMATGGAATLQNVRDAYRALFPDDLESLNWPDSTIQPLRMFVRAAQPANAAEADELELLNCKVELRAAKPDDDASLGRVKECLDFYISRPRPPALLSEARGWIARTNFLRGKQTAAAKFYLSELASETSNIRRQRLVNSLAGIAFSVEDIDEYLDTPGHALFLTQRVTNADSPAELQHQLMSRLEARADLFGQTATADALAIALMRLATRTGAPTTTLRYAERIPPNADSRRGAEYNWLVGLALFEQENYTGAEAALKRVLTATDRNDALAASAANGLVGVYAKLNRPLDQLWAAFVAASVSEGLSLDASYLLDVTLTDAQLDAFQRRYPDSSDIVFARYPQRRSARDAVRYAQAVRLARREQFSASAQLFEVLGSTRAATMRQAGQLLAATAVSDSGSDRQLQALYDYAEFLSNNEDGIFYNDMLWYGFQTSALIYRSRDGASLPAREDRVSPDEVARLSQLEGRLVEQQEEYWRAYRILNQVVQKAGATPLGKKAAQRAIVCLRRINIGRFGHAREIRAADLRLSGWLQRQP